MNFVPTQSTSAPQEVTPKEEDTCAALRAETTTPGLTLSGKVPTKMSASGGKQLKILLDSGASHSVFDDGLATRMNLDRQRQSHAKAKLADGRQTNLGDDLAPVRLHLGAYTCRQKFKTMNLGDYDILLGRDWLKRSNPNRGLDDGFSESESSRTISDIATVEGANARDTSQLSGLHQIWSAFAERRRGLRGLRQRVNE